MPINSHSRVSACINKVTCWSYRTPNLLTFWVHRWPGTWAMTTPSISPQWLSERLGWGDILQVTVENMSSAGGLNCLMLRSWALILSIDNAWFRLVFIQVVQWLIRFNHGVIDSVHSDLIQINRWNDVPCNQTSAWTWSVWPREETGLGCAYFGSTAQNNGKASQHTD